MLDHDGRDVAVDELEEKLAALGRRNRSTRLKMILSDPCFEYWLLLHFELTDRPFVAAGKGKTACDEVVEALRRNVPRYQKNDVRVFDQFREHMDTAASNAEQLESLGSASSSGSPSTDVGRLVTRLRGIAAR